MSIKEADLARHAHMPLDQAKKVMQRMVDRGELQVRASGEKADRILHFDEPPMPAASDVAKCHEELDAALKRMMRLGNAIKHFDTAVSHNTIYMERSKRMGDGPMDGGGEGGANGDGMHNDGEDFGTATPIE
jgi:exonuclease VII small subunit